MEKQDISVATYFAGRKYHAIHEVLVGKDDGEGSLMESVPEKTAQTLHSYVHGALRSVKVAESDPWGSLLAKFPHHVHTWSYLLNLELCNTLSELYEAKEIRDVMARGGNPEEDVHGVARWALHPNLQSYRGGLLLWLQSM